MEKEECNSCYWKYDLNRKYCGMFIYKPVSNFKCSYYLNKNYLNKKEN